MTKEEKIAEVKRKGKLQHPYVSGNMDKRVYSFQPPSRKAKAYLGRLKNLYNEMRG